MLNIRCTNPERPSTHILLVGKTYTVGRRNADLTFADDPSISRNHATIVVEHPMANMGDPPLTPTVVITDLGSKFGTFANDGIERRSKLAMREAQNLGIGDRFKFGLQWHEFTIHYTPLVVTPSAIRDVSLRELKTTIMTLGGHLVHEWVPECDYVIMESLSLTVKVVCALLAAKHIVTPVFFKDMLSCVNTRKTLPNPDDFLPPMADEEKNIQGTFEPITGRKELFAGKIFVFCGSKHMKRLSLVVEAGGGTCKQLSDVEIRDLLKEDYILMKPSDRDMIVADHNTRAALEEYGKTKRLVQDSELGLAALYMTTNKHCNPYHSFNESIPTKLPQTQNSDKSHVILHGTENADADTQLSTAASDSSNVVEETFAEGNRSKVKVKVKDEVLSESMKQDLKSEGEPPSKKRPAEDVLTGTREKRLRPQDSLRSLRGTHRGGLSAIFGLSDDEDDDVVIPSTQPQTGRQEMESATSDPSLDADVDIVPASPDMIEEVPEKSVFKSPERRTTRAHARSSPDMIEEVPEKLVSKSPERRTTRAQARSSPQKDSQIELQPSGNGSGGVGRTKRKILQSPETSPVKIESQPVKKQKTKESKGSTDNENLVQKAEKLTIKPDVKDILNNEIPTPRTVEVHMPLLYKGPKIEPKIQVVDGKTVKNFKCFKKVLPLSMQTNNVSIASSSSRGTNTTTRSMKLTYEVFGYPPSIVSSYKKGQPEKYDYETPEDNMQPQIKRRITRDEDENVAIDDIMPEMETPPQDNTRTSRRVTCATNQEQVREEPPPSPPPPPRQNVKKIQRVFLSDDEDDDMFQF